MNRELARVRREKDKAYDAYHAFRRGCPLKMTNAQQAEAFALQQRLQGWWDEEARILHGVRVGELNQ